MSRSNNPKPNGPPDDGVPPVSSNQVDIGDSWEPKDPHEESELAEKANGIHKNAETAQDDGQVNGEPAAAMAAPEPSSGPEVIW